MKLNIPTSSLNFNNIMSCESISPFAFYELRNFGYKSFYNVELNNFNNSLLLYEIFPDFQMPKSDLVNYSMVIEVDIEKETDGLSFCKEGIWQIDRTIYLNPFTSKIFFISLDHKNIVLSRSEASAETKLVSLYHNNIQVFQGEKKYYQLEGITDLPFPNMHQIEIDRQKNKIKGFAYAYIIAANNSISKEIVKLKNIVGKIDNISSAIVNSVSGYGTQQQNEELKLLLNDFDKYQYIEIKEYLKSIIPDKFEDVWNKLYKVFGLRISGQFNFGDYIQAFTDKTRYEAALKELKSKFKKIEHDYISSKSKFEWTNIALSGIKLTQYEDAFIAKQDTKEMYQNLINDIFVLTDITESSFSSEKSRLADEITVKIKSYIGENWENHQAKKHLNSLRRNLAGQEEFNIKWDSGLISAIGTFIIKGEDFEKLSDFLTLVEIEDGRLSFGLYGCICGFANMSRVFTKSFYDSEIQYISRIYKAIYKQLNGIDISGELLTNKEFNKNSIAYQPDMLKQIKPDDKVNENSSSIEKSKDYPKCPKCEADMVLKKHEKGDFYGCTNYYRTKCNGKRDLDFNELDERFKVIDSKNELKYINLILEYISNNSPCKISDLNKYLISKTDWSHNVDTAKKFIKENLASKIELTKIKKAEAAKLRENNLFLK